MNSLSPFVYPPLFLTTVTTVWVASFLAAAVHVVHAASYQLACGTQSQSSHSSTAFRSRGLDNTPPLHPTTFACLGVSCAYSLNACLLCVHHDLMLCNRHFLQQLWGGLASRGSLAAPYNAPAPPTAPTCGHNAVPLFVITPLTHVSARYPGLSQCA